MPKEMISLMDAENMDLPEEKLDVFAAFALLEKENLRLLETNEQAKCTIQLFDKKDKLIFSQQLEFPLEAEIEEVLKEKLQEIPISEEVPSEEVQDVPEEYEPIQVPQKRKCKSKRILWTRRKKKVIGVIAVLCLLLPAGFYYRHEFLAVFPKAPVASSEVVEKSWDELVSDAAYPEAAEKYPEKLGDLISLLTENKNFEALEAVNKAYPTPEGTFDLAFYHEDWKQVIQTELPVLTKERKIMMAYAFIMLDQLEEAEILNQQLQSQRITKALEAKHVEQGIHYLREKNIDEAKALMKKISQKELQQSFQDHIDTAEIMLELIKHYEAKGEVENQELWERKLRNIGKEANDET